MYRLASIAITILEGMFVVGVLGSMLVVVLTTVEDVRALVRKDISPPRAE